MYVKHPAGSNHTRMIGSALTISAPSPEFLEALRRRKASGQAIEHPDLRDGPEHVITGGRQEGKTHLALQWLMDEDALSQRVLIVSNDDIAQCMMKDLGLKRSDQRIISFRRLLNPGARKGVEYGIDETVDILVKLLKLHEVPHLITVAHAEEWQG